jgi:hypothetical protein
MKTDFYTKAVLTVISICLLIIVFQNGNFINEAHAAIEPVSKYAVVPVNSDGSINVRIKSIDGPQEVLLVGWKESVNDLSYEVRNLGKRPLPVISN